MLVSRGCYLVGQRVALKGVGFAPSQMYDVAIDGVDLGQNTTDAIGAFSTSLIPGGLGAGVIEHVYHLDATDGTASAAAGFTVTRRTGGRFLASSGSPRSLRAPFEVWDFARSNRSTPVYLHYVTPQGRVRRTVLLGHTGGQCGFLKTARRKVFPFSPSFGTWTLQLDARRTYSNRPGAPVTRIRVVVRSR